MHIGSFCDIVRQAAKTSDDRESVNIVALRQRLYSPAWEDINDDSSILCKLLRYQDVFKANEEEEDVFSVKKLICFALLHCQGKFKHKADELLNLLQDGNAIMLEHISANDKDYKEIFKILCAQASYQGFSMLEEFDPSHTNPYKDC